MAQQQPQQPQQPHIPSFFRYIFSFPELDILAPTNPKWNIRIGRTDGGIEANCDTLQCKVSGHDRPTCEEDWRKATLRKYSSSHFEFAWEGNSTCKRFTSFNDLVTFLHSVTSGTAL